MHVAPGSPNLILISIMIKTLLNEKGTTKEALAQKKVLTSDEAADYMGVSKSYLYKLTMRHEIPHYKPRGKMCYFNRQELEQWLQRNRVATVDEIEAKAQAYCMRKGGAI